MKADPPLLVHPHRRGPWLVLRGGRRLAMPDTLGRRLLPWHGRRPDPEAVRRALLGGLPSTDPTFDAAVDDLVAALWSAPAPGGRGPRFRLVLLRPQVVRGLAGPLVAAAGVRSLMLLAVMGLAGLAWGWSAWTSPGSGGAGDMAAALVIFLASGILHELGHAAALLRSGYPPGAVGVGLVFVLPVLWCDVSAVSLLERRERLRIDLAGPVWQLAMAGLLAVLGRAAPGLGPAPGGAAAAAVAAVTWSLLPFIRSDGFWAVADLTGIGDLDRRPTPADPPGVVRLLWTYRLLRAAFLVVVGGTLVLRLLAFLRTVLA